MIEAIQLPLEGVTPEEDWVDADWESGDHESLIIHTLEGAMRADPGDWIIKGVRGELYPCKPDIFAETYEPVYGGGSGGLGGDGGGGTGFGV